MDVPHGMTVTIPALRAHKSKDLWRAISQKRLFHLQSGPAMAFPPSLPTHDASGVDVYQEHTRILLRENQLLRDALEKKDSEMQSKLDNILGLLQAGVPVAPPSPVRGTAPQVVTGVVSGEVPTFIPSQIKPEGVEVQITTTAEESAGAGVSSAASALRKFRKAPQ